MPPRKRKGTIKANSKVSQENNNSLNTSSVSQLSAQAERDIADTFKQVVTGIVDGGLEASAVTNVQKQSLLAIMKKSPKLF